MANRRRDLRATDGSRTTAEWRQAGMSRHAVLRDLIRTSHGRYRVGGHEGPAQRIADVAALLPAGGVIGGWAAAWLHGVDLLDGRSEVTLQPYPVDVLLPPGGRRRSTTGVRYRQTTGDTADSTPAIKVAGVPITPVLLTAEHLARWADDLVAAVVAVDSLLGARLVPAVRVLAVLADLRDGRGCVQARRCAELCRVGVRSPWESRTRLFCELKVGLPSLLVNESIFDLAGSLLAIPDLLDEEAGLAIEYDGARWLDGRGHRDPTQHHDDNVREERLERTGMIVVRLDRADLAHHRTELRTRLLAARGDGLRRDRRRDRWTRTPPPGWMGWPA